MIESLKSTVETQNGICPKRCRSLLNAITDLAQGPESRLEIRSVDNLVHCIAVALIRDYGGFREFLRCHRLNAFHDIIGAVGGDKHSIAHEFKKRNSRSGVGSGGWHYRYGIHLALGQLRLDIEYAYGIHFRIEKIHTVWQFPGERIYIKNRAATCELPGFINVFDRIESEFNKSLDDIRHIRLLSDLQRYRPGAEILPRGHFLGKSLGTRDHTTQSRGAGKPVKHIRSQNLRRRVNLAESDITFIAGRKNGHGILTRDTTNIVV